MSEEYDAEGNPLEVHAHIVHVHRVEGNHQEDYDLNLNGDGGDEGPDTLTPEQREQTELFGPGGRLHGLTPMNNPTRWEKEFGHYSDEEQATLRHLATSAYKTQVAHATEARQKAARHAISAERVRRGILKKQYEAHPKRIVQWTAQLSVPQDEPSVAYPGGSAHPIPGVTGDVHATDLQQLRREIDQKINLLYGPKVPSGGKTGIAADPI